jgi:tetratricopeptide (TPR) repeat protein
MQIRGDLAAALADYDHAIRIKPTFADAYLSRGAIRKAVGDVIGAIEDFESALHAAGTAWSHREATEAALRAAREVLKK